MNEESSQLTLSYELLYLIRWLVENEPEQLKKIIQTALDSGLKEDFKQTYSTDQEKAVDAMHYNIVDFLNLLEGLLHESINEHTIKNVMQKKLMPAIDQIDTTECDTFMVQESVEKASNEFEQNPKNNAQDILFKELLKSWNPEKKITN